MIAPPPTSKASLTTDMPCNSEAPQEAETTASTSSQASTSKSRKREASNNAETAPSATSEVNTETMTERRRRGKRIPMSVRRARKRALLATEPTESK